MHLIENMIEISLEKQDDFLKVRETLTRIGVASRRTNTLFQSCHILHKQGKYYIVHFKELFALDGKESTITDEDIGRRNSIIQLLAEWDLVKILKKDSDNFAIKLPISKIKIIPHKFKDQWELIPKYNIGKKKV
tara:strand:- start:804 stop:1205 length:402 start_codon:yes stop_codon:yes gene_type:complete